MPQTGVPTADITNANHFLDNLGSRIPILVQLMGWGETK